MYGGSEDPVQNVLQQLLARRVPQTLFVYLGVCWALIEVSAFVEERFALGRWLADSVMLVLLCGLMSAMVLAWNHGKRGPDPWKRSELLFHGLVAVLAVGLVVWRVSGGLEGSDAVEAAEEEDALATAQATDDGEGAAAKDQTVEGPDSAEMLEALPEVAPESERRCLMVAPAALGDGFGEEDRWISAALEFGVIRVLNMRRGMRLGQVSVWLKDELKAQSIGRGDVIPISFLFDKSEKNICENVLTMTAQRADGDGDEQLLQVEVSLYPKGQHDTPLTVRTDPMTMMALSEFIASWTLPGLGLPETPALPSLAETMSAEPKVMELLVKSSIKVYDKDLEGATKLLDEVLELDPNCVDALQRRANAYLLEEGMGAKAQQQKLLGRMLKQLHRLPPSSRWQVQASVLLDQNKPELAERIVDRQLEIDPDNIDAKWTKVTLLKLLHGANEETLPYLREIVADDPKHREALQSFVMSLTSLDRLEEAESITRKWMTELPQDVEAHKLLGRCLRTQGRFDEARRVYEDVIAMEPEVTQHALLIVNLDLTEGRFEQAAQELDRLEQLEEEGLEDFIQASRKRLAYRMGQPKYRLKIAREQLAAKENNRVPLMVMVQKSMLVSSLLEAGKDTEAKAIVDELSALKIELLAPLAADAQQKWAIHNEDADALEASLDHEDQLASESVVAAISSRNNVLSRARVDRFRGNCESAIAKLDALVEDKPSTVRRWNYVEERMLCLMELERFEEAVEVGRAAAAHDPGDADIYELLARAYDGAKKPREARKTYERLLELWANAEDDYKRMLDARSALLELSARSE